MGPKKIAKEVVEKKRMTYTETMVDTLLILVITTGAHLAVGAASTAKWTEVYRLFYLDAEVLPFKDKFYLMDKDGKVNFRNLKDKYTNVLEIVTADIEKGNKSGREGELSKTYKMVKQITDEIEDADEAKESAKSAKAEDKKKLESNEATVLGKRNKNPSSTGVRNVDGTIVIDEEKAARRAARVAANTSGFDTTIQQYLNQKMATAAIPIAPASAFDAVAVNINHYAHIEAVMNQFVESMPGNIPFDLFLDEVFCNTGKFAPPSLVETLQGLGGK